MIDVLLSTYNGAEYLPTLLESLIEQDCPDITIVIRDDGSTDGTRDILSRYEQEHPLIRIMHGPNIGASRSFFELLNHISDTARFVAFCDQDDYWEPDKISRSIEMLAGRESPGPMMYCSRLTIADGHLTPIRSSSLPSRPISFRNALVENIVTGATVVLNRDAVDLLTVRTPEIDRIEMYDWWIYQTLSALGGIVFDDQSRIISRQHGGNVVGLPFGANWLRSKLRFISSGDRSKISTQAGEFSRLFRSQLSDEDRMVLDEFLSIVHDSRVLKRMKFALSRRVYRQRLIDDLLLRIRIISARI